jgi:ATP-binding protein involved in chromosome partitioning
MAEQHNCHGQSVHGSGSQGKTVKEEDQDKTIERIKHKIVVLSGKGGVGKSTVAVNLAVALGIEGKKVGLLDVDIHGPSVPKMLHLDGAKPDSSGDKLLPVDFGGMKVMSIGFLLPDQADAVIWRGPAKAAAIKQFISGVEWGDLDYLIVDCPPGTGDEPLTVVQTLGSIDGAVVVTTPQELAITDVRKSITFCGKLNLPVLGVIENMSGFVCPHCSKTVDIFKSGGGETMAKEMRVPFLGRIPLDSTIMAAADDGTPHVYHYDKTEAAKAFSGIVTLIDTKITAVNQREGDLSIMRIAVPICEGLLSMHFGHCEKFALVDIDPETKTISGTTSVEPPPHEPGLLPGWLYERGVNLVIAGGMGKRAQDLFVQAGVNVITGASAANPESVVMDFLAGNLVTGANVCDH